MKDFPYISRHAKGSLPGHRHRESYYAVVVEGRYLERSVDGTFMCRQGMIVSHPAFHWHHNYFHSPGAVVINVCAKNLAAYKVNRLTRKQQCSILEEFDPESVYSAVQTGPSEIRQLAPPKIVDEMKSSLLADPSIKISELAKQMNISAAYACRVFQLYTGLTPSFFRGEVRVRTAIASIERGSPLSTIAAEFGFSDQSHMGREIRKVTGRTAASFRTNQ